MQLSDSRSVIKSPNGSIFVVPRGSSCELSVTFTDCTGESALQKSDFSSLYFTLQSAYDGSLINGRSRQSVLDENGGSLSVDGVLSLNLSPEDNETAGSLLPGDIEPHYLLFEWEFVDLELNPQTGRAEFILHVMETTR